MLHMDLQGNTRLLWEHPGGIEIYGVPSPDGRHLAMRGLERGRQHVDDGEFLKSLGVNLLTIHAHEFCSFRLELKLGLQLDHAAQQHSPES